MPKVSSGSQIAALGMRNGLTIPNFRPSAKVISAARPTSDPVPAVVGIAITGATAAVIKDSPPSIKAKRESGPSWVAKSATAFAKSMGEPPPSATTPSHPAAL